MKKRTHKILSWVLTIAMVLGMLPAMSLPAAAEDTYVTHVDLQMEAPKAGMTAAEYAATVGIDNQHEFSYNVLVVDTVNCYRIDNSSFAQVGKDVSSFVEGGVYQCWVEVTLSDDGYSFDRDDSKMTVLVNGQTLNNYDYDGLNGGAAGFDNDTYELTYTLYFTATAAGDGINVSRSSGSSIRSGDGWTWDRVNGKLTLNGYAGGPIYIGGSTAGDVEIELVGTNSATVSQATGDSYCAGIEVMNANTVTFTGSGTLRVNATTEDSNIVSAYGIYLNNSYGTGDVMFRNGTTVRVDSTKQTSGAGMTYGIYTDGSSGDVTVEEGATLRVYPTSNDYRRLTTGIYSARSGDVTMNGTVQINQIYSDSSTPSTSWSSVFANTITIGANADVDVMMPFARTHGLDYALLAANGNTAVKDCSWTKVTTTGKSFQNDSCLLILSAEDGADIYYRLQYKKVDPMTFTHLDAYDVPEGTAGTAWTAETALSASVGGGSGKFTYEIVSGPEGLSINSAKKLVYTRPAAAQAATTATVRATDAEGGLTRDITIAIGAVTEAPVSEGITITGSTPTQNHATWSYVKDTNTLTLNGYQGGGIFVSGINTLNLVLTNSTYNTITVNGTDDVYGIQCGDTGNSSLNISGGGTLIIRSSNTGTRTAYGIYGYEITQTGGYVSIYADSADGMAYGVCGKSGVSVTGGTLTVNATVQKSHDCFGIYAVAGEILVDSGAEAAVTIHNIGGGSVVHGIYNEASAAGSLENNGSITLNGTVSVTRAENSTGQVNGITNKDTQYNTSGVISVGSGANVTLTDTCYGIASYTRYQAGLADVSITGGTVNITSTYSDSCGIYSGYNGVSITGGTVTVNTQSTALWLDKTTNTQGIIDIGGSAVVNLTSATHYAVYTGDTASSARVHTLDFTSSTGSFTAKSNRSDSSYQSYPVQAYFRLGTNTYLSEGIASGYNEEGGQMFSSGTLNNRVKVSYKQANAHPDLGAVKVNGYLFDVSTLYYKNDATGTYDGADDAWNAYYEPTTGVLELKDYAGGPIEIGGSNPTVVELKLTGANTINNSTATGNYCAGVQIVNADTATVTGTGSLTVNVNAGDGIKFAYGIYLYSRANAQSDLTIQSGTVDLNIQYTGTDTAPYVVGIYTRDDGNKSGKVTVGADAAVHAAVTSGQYSSYAKGIWAKGDVALNGETSLRLTYTGTGSPSNDWTSVTTTGSVTIGDGASVRVDMPTGRDYGLNNALLAAAEGKTVDGAGWPYDNSVYKTSENENFRMVATDKGNGVYADFDYMSKSGATAVEGITVTAAETALSANGTTTVTAAVTPEDATYPGVLWSSGNPDVTVDASGKVTAGLGVHTNPGKAVLTATSKYDTSVTGSTAITVGTPDSSKIYEVFAQVPAPVVGEKPATAADVTVDAGFSVHNVIWRCRADEKSEWGSLSGDTFVAGMLYQVEVDIQEQDANKDYADAGRMAAYVNGKAVPVTSIYGSFKNIASVYCTFGKAAAASSGGAIPDANFVTVDGGKPFAAPNQLYFKNDGEATTTDSSSYNARYDPSTGVLELRNYNGGPIVIGGNVEADITIKLVGANVITSSGQFGIVNHHGGDITITADSDATLTINVTNDAMEATGIACDRTESYPGCSRAITIGGKARVTVNATSTDTRDIKTAAGLRTPGTVTIRDDASFQAVCKSATPSIGVQAGVGILAYKGVTIDTTGTVEIDVSGCTSIGTIAIYGSAANALTEVTSMTLKWKQSGVDGGMLYPAGSFDSAAETHAVNVDSANRVATYRYGRPYTVTVNNGSCDAVGLRYLEGDTVTVTAGTIEGLEFTKWTSEQVASFSPSNTSSTATFTMPAQDVTVTADFGAFAVPPVFTLISEGIGNIAFTMVKEPSNRPKLVQAGSEDVYNKYYFDYDTNYSCSIDVMESNVPAGEYQIAVQYSDKWLYSDVFTVSYAGTPQATVKDKTVSGTRGEELMNPVEVTIVLKFDTFQNVAVGDNVGSWFTNLPAGLTAVINSVGSDMKSVNITINGTPTKVKNEAMAITIPGEKLTISETDLTVTENPNARFEIAESPYALTKLNLSAELNLEALMSYGSITTTVPAADGDKYDIIVLGVKLSGTELGTADVADPGEQLTLTVGVAAKAPYLLTTADLESLKVQVGGHGAGPVRYYSGGGYGYKSVTKNGLDYWEFSVPDAFTVPAYTFSNITFTIPEAETGTSPSSTVAVQNGTEAPGSKLASAVAWTDLGTDGTGTTAMTGESKFQGGHYYECRVTFTSTDTTNYLFPESGMTITANGGIIPEKSSPNDTPLSSCFVYGIDPETGKACYTVYLRSKLAEEGKLDLTGVSRTDGTISYTILPSGTATSLYVFAAQYKDGKLVDVKRSALIAIEKTQQTGTLTGFTHAEGCTYKLFLLENGKYVPLCNAADIP